MNRLHGIALTSIVCIHGMTACGGAGSHSHPGSPNEPPPGSNSDRRPDGEPMHEGIGPAGPAPSRHHHAHDRMNHRFEDAERWAGTFDAPERDTWQQPDLVVAAALGQALRADSLLVDLGAGTGYFTMRFARALPKGTVVAADVESSMLQWISRRALGENLANVRTHLTSATGLDWVPALGTPDVLFLCNTYHHIEDRVNWFGRARAVVAPDGRLVIVDFRPESPRGPPRHHKLEASAVIAELAAAGWSLVQQHDFLPDQYMLTFAANR